MNTRRLWLAAFLLGFALPGIGAVPKADFFVAPNGNDNWSGKLAAPNAARSDGPFATLTAAQAAVRHLHQQAGRHQPVTVMLRGGAYRIDSPIVFGPEDSGIAQCPIEYVAYPGEKPAIDGGRKITGFVQSGKLWTVTLPDVKAGRWYFSELFVNGQRMTRARTPNSGFFHVAGYLPPKADAAGRTNRTAFYFKPGDIERWKNLDDAVVTVYHSWETSLLHIKSVDMDKHIVEFTGPSTWRFGYWGPNQRYTVENIPEALDAPGEWYLERKSGVLSYYPLPGQTIDSADVVAPTTTELIHIAGDAEIGLPVTNITFRGITFQHADWQLGPQGDGGPQAACTVPAAIMLTGADDVRFENCEIAHVGTYGVWLRAGCHGCRIIHSHLYDLGAGGIRIGETSMAADAVQVADGNVVDNDYIHGYGRVYAAGVGVYIAQASDDEVTHNEVCDGYYSGMSIGWNWGQTPTQAHNNLIAYNHIHHVMQGLLSDGGGIYTLGTSPGTVIRNNVIHDVFSYSQPLIAWGIYLDAESNQITVENNLCYNVQNGGLMMHNGSFANTIRNNIFAHCALETVWRALPRGAPDVFERNICYVTQGSLFLRDAAPDVKSTWDHNLYWRTDGKELLFNGETWEDWHALGLDQHSLIADPEFVDPAHDDFRLKPTSPAITKLGFQPFDISKCGLYGDAAWTALPKQLKFPPTVLPPAPAERGITPIVDDFEDTPVGAEPKDAVCAYGEIPGGKVAVTDELAASGKKSVKVTDAPGLQHDWDPHFFYQPHFTRGIAHMHFKLNVGPGALPWIEWRSGGYPYAVGPSLKIDAKDQLVANGQVLMSVPRNKWIAIEITYGLGKLASGTYDLRVTVPGQDAREFPKVPCDAKFRRLEWLGFVSLATTTTEFYVDDISLTTTKE